MPNYCDNYLTIEGNENTLKTIMELVRSDETVFDFNKIVPMPDYIYQGPLGKKERELYGENNWYDWSCKNWGTKWNSMDAEVYDNEFYFQTAWSPAEPVIAALAAMFPTMRFTYTFYETGMCFCGQRIYEDGNLLFYYDGDYADNPDCYSEYAQEYSIHDEFYPIQDTPIFEDVRDVEISGEIIRGKLFYREYENNMISKLTNGMFVAKKSFKFSFVKEADTLRQAA